MLRCVAARALANLGPEIKYCVPGTGEFASVRAKAVRPRLHLSARRVGGCDCRHHRSGFSFCAGFSCGPPLFFARAIAGLQASSDCGQWAAGVRVFVAGATIRPRSSWQWHSTGGRYLVGQRHYSVVACATGKVRGQCLCHCAGVAAGLGAAFNAPLAGIMLVTEEMRDEFDYNHLSLLCVMLASCTAVVVSYGWLGQGLDLNLGLVTAPPLTELPLYLLLGTMAGALAVLYNRGLLISVAWFASLGTLYTYLAGAGVGILIGSLLWISPDLVGGGERLIEQAATHPSPLLVLLAILMLRTVLSVLSYGTGVPGGIFAPLLALGALLGLVFSAGLTHLLPGLTSTPLMFTVAAMGALFAGTVRAPLTGIVLIIELTGAFDASLSIIITCAMATIVAGALSGTPIYSQLRKRDASK